MHIFIYIYIYTHTHIYIYLYINIYIDIPDESMAPYSSSILVASYICGGGRKEGSNKEGRKEGRKEGKERKGRKEERKGRKERKEGRVVVMAVVVTVGVAMVVVVMAVVVTVGAGRAQAPTLLVISPKVKTSSLTCFSYRFVFNLVPLRFGMGSIWVSVGKWLRMLSKSEDVKF
jgi:hypothetical protein